MKKPRKKRDTRKRPVLQFPVLQSVYDEIAATAKAKGLTISEEAAYRVAQQKFFGEIRVVILEAVKQALREVRVTI